MKKIVIADDEPSVRKILESTVSRNGYEVYTADSVNATLEQVETNHPDLVMTDMTMPYKGAGVDVINGLPSVGYTGPVIVLTSHQLDRSRIQQYPGPVEYIDKLLELNKILPTIDRLLFSSNKGYETKERREAG